MQCVAENQGTNEENRGEDHPPREVRPNTSRVSAFNRLGNQNPANPAVEHQQQNPANKEPDVPPQEREDLL